MRYAVMSQYCPLWQCLTLLKRRAKQYVIKKLSMFQELRIFLVTLFPILIFSVIKLAHLK